jgi:hypothetical protein
MTRERIEVALREPARHTPASYQVFLRDGPARGDFTAPPQRRPGEAVPRFARRRASQPQEGLPTRQQVPPSRKSARLRQGKGRASRPGSGILVSPQGGIDRPILRQSLWQTDLPPPVEANAVGAGTILPTSATATTWPPPTCPRHLAPNAMPGGTRDGSKRVPRRVGREAQVADGGPQAQADAGTDRRHDDAAIGDEGSPDPTDEIG